MTKKMVMPWEDRPAGCADVMWRYSKNPVIDRYHIPSSNSIFNSAVVPFEDGFAGVFRCDNKAVQMNIFAGFSKDGIHWDIWCLPGAICCIMKSVRPTNPNP